MNDSDRSRKGEDWVPIAAVLKKGCELDSGRITRYRLTSRARKTSVDPRKVSIVHHP